MTPAQLEKRKRIMQRSIALGHCICDPRKPCPCDLFKDKGICECAGERLPKATTSVRLTETVRSPGCSSKISKRDLHEVLQGLPDLDDPRVLVGRVAGDDAGVILLNGDTATVLTVDIFSPSVDDAYTFGQIAAANSISDVYAMGALPQVALAIIGFPIHTLPAETMKAILRGGTDKMAEAGISVIGGHSINDEEVKCGFAVVGHVPKDEVITNTGAAVGDAVVLTKPLGVAIVAFAHQIHRAQGDSIQAIATSMASLNRVAGTRMREFGAHAATDVTGFSLLGHMAEVAKNSNVTIDLDFDAVPLFPGVQTLAQNEVIPGGVERNRESVPETLLDLTPLTPAQRAVLFCPETSGGLLVFLPEDSADTFVTVLHENGVAAAGIIGRVTETREGGLIRATTQTAAAWETRNLRLAETIVTTTPNNQSPICCAGGTPETDEGSCCSGGTQTDKASCCAASAPAPAPAPPAAAGFLVAPGAADAFKAYMGAVNQPDALGPKEKKLIALALSVVSKCGPCIKIQTKGAREAGATDEEIAEAVALGISFGGASVNMYYQELMQGKA